MVFYMMCLQREHKKIFRFNLKHVEVDEELIKNI